MAPFLVEALEDWRPGIPGSLLAPPPAVLAAAMAKTWRIEADLSGGGANLVVDTTVELSGTLARRSSMSLGSALSSAEFSDNEEEGDATVSLIVRPGYSGRIVYDWVNGMWFPGIQVQAVLVVGGGSSEVGTAGCGQDIYDASAVGGVALTYCGEALGLRGRTSDDGDPPAGTITVSPVDYLPPE